MSYCRFSSDDWKSDVYVYLGGDGIVVHTAWYRHIGHIPKLPKTSVVGWDKFSEAYDRQLKAVGKSPRKKIESEHAGKSFVCRTVAEAIITLGWLREEGFRVPQFVFEKLKEEENELKK